MAKMTITDTIQNIPVSKLKPHPQNPRIAMREDVVTAIAANLTGGFDPAHALIVRPIGDGFQIISGHHRHAAATHVGIQEVPCWVRDMDDDDAYMALATSNSQGELSPLEIGMHALHHVGLSEGGRGKKGGLSEYAVAIGRAYSTVAELVSAARVSENSTLERRVLLDKTKHLASIHSLPQSAWQVAVDTMLSADWSAKDTAAAVARVKEVVSEKPDWFESDTDIAGCLLSASKAKIMAGLYRAAARMSDQLPESVTTYTVEETDQTKESGGREYRLHAPVAVDFAARKSFQHWVNDHPEASARDIESKYQNMRQYMNELSEPREVWRPVLTDEEQREKEERERELARLSMRDMYMPKLICGDALESMRRLPDSSFDLVCVDPPYNMSKADWDSLGSGVEFAEWAESWLKEAHRLLKDSGAIYVFGINRMLSHIQHRMDAIGFRFRNWITWDTIQGAGGGLWVNRSESILYYSKTDQTYEDADSVKLERHEENVREYKGKEYAFKSPSNVWRFPCVDENHPDRTGHPTQKPVELIERIIKASSPVDGRVLDCFIGSGTTGVACMKNRRICTGIDASREYLDIAQSRFDDCEVQI